MKCWFQPVIMNYKVIHTELKCKFDCGGTEMPSLPGTLEKNIVSFII